MRRFPINTDKYGHSLRAGVTLVELIVVIAISAIVAGVAIPSTISWYDGYKTSERQANAELVYTTAQNNMASLKANGLLSRADNDKTNPDTDERPYLAKTISDMPSRKANLTNSDNDNIVVIRSDDSTVSDAFQQLVPDIANQVSRVGYLPTFNVSGGQDDTGSVTGCHYAIELNPKTGYIYATYFSEDDMTEELYNKAADLRNTIPDEGTFRSELAKIHVAYYGGTKPQTFTEKKKEPVSWVGYFEFTKDNGGDANADATVTGGYFYPIINTNGQYSTGELEDRLKNDALIEENAVDSSDGTAYGVLVSKNEVDTNRNYVPPSNVSRRYFVKNAIDIDGAPKDCYFYELNSPSTNESAQKAHYHILFEYWDTDGNGNPVSYNHDDSDWHGQKQAAVGSTVRVTNSDIPDTVRARIENENYRIDETQSVLSGTVASDGSLALVVHLTKNGKGSKELSNDTGAIIDGVSSEWHPWGESSGAVSSLNSIAFTINQNFAAAIKAGAKAELGNDFQVRTDDQLQHIGSPYGSTYDKPITTYLTDDFYQTHDIKIDQLWYPIGQNSTSAQSTPTTAFAGKFYGTYAGRSNENHKVEEDGLAAPKTSDNVQPFTITLAGQPNATNDEDKAKQFSDNPAYDTSDGYRSYGIFGYVTGTIGYANVSIGSESTDPEHNVPFRFKQAVADPHYGTLAGDLVNGTIEHSDITIAKNSSLDIEQSGGYGGSDRSTMVGGLCGNMAGTARLADSSLTLEQAGSSTDGDNRFQLTSDANWSSSEATNTGGLVGRADCSDRSSDQPFIDNCTLTLNDGALLKASGASSGVVNMGGFIASSVGNGTIANSKTLVAKTLSFGRTDGNAWGPNISVGGFIGTAGDSRSSATQDNRHPAIDASSLSIDNGATVNIDVSYNNASPLTLGGFAGRVTQMATLNNDSISNDGSLSISGSVQSSGSISLGGFAGTVSTTSNAVPDGNTVTGNVISCKVTGTGNLSVDAKKSAIAVNVGGFSGTVSADSSIEKSSLDLDGNVNVASENSQQNISNVGGFAGTVTDKAIVSKPSVSLGTGNFSASATNIRYAGGVIGSIDKNASVAEPSLASTGDVSVSTTGAENDYNSSYTGGLIGYAAPDSDAATISGAKADIAGNMTLTSSASSNAYTGGLAAKAKSVTFDNANLTFTKDLNITATGNGYNSEYAAGLIGATEESVVANSPTLKVDGKLSVSTPKSGDTVSYAAGMFGDFGSKANASDANLEVNDMEITADSTRTSYAGAVIAYAKSEYSATAVSGVTGSVKGDAALKATSSNEAYTGGFAGKTESTSIDNATLTFAKDLTATAQGGGNGTGRAAGFIGSATGTAAIKAPKVKVDGTLSTNVPQTDNATAYSAGMFGNAEGTTAITDPALTAQTANIAANSNSTAYAAGIIGDLEGASTLAGADATMHNLDTSANATGSASGYAAGLAGRVKTSAETAMSDVKLTIDSGSSINSTADDSSHAAGLIGRVESGKVTNARLSADNNLQVQATSGKSAYAAGLVGRMSSSTASYLALRGLKDAASSDKPKISVSANAKDSTSPEAYVGGAFGDVNNSRIENSYLAARQSTLQLDNSTSKDDAYTGGFAGRMTGNSDEGGASFCYVYADIRSDHNKGISAFVDRFDKSLLRSCFVVGTMADSNGNKLDNAYAFARKSAFANQVSERPSGDYAAVTDTQGDTPYTFLDWNPEDSDISTPGCVIYNSKAVDPTPENDPKGRTGKRSHGAHEVSYTWLTDNATYDEAYNTKEFKAEDDPYYYRDFTSYLKSKNKAAERYPYVKGSEVDSDYRDSSSHYDGLTGSNPFPTATKDTDGRHINYGKWIPKPQPSAQRRR